MLCVCDFEDKLSAPPAHFSVKDFLETIKNDTHHDPFSMSIKEEAQYGANNLELFELLAGILWCRIVNIFRECLPKSGEHTTNRDFICATTQLNHLFLTKGYRSDLVSAFNVHSWSDINDGQRTLGMQLVFHIYKLVTSELSKLVRTQEVEHIPFTVSEMGPDGRGKIRYIGGWAVRKYLEKSRRYTSFGCFCAVLRQLLTVDVTFRIQH